MALDSYTALQSTIAAYVARTDTDFLNRVPDFITMAETMLNAILRHRRMVVTSAIVVPINIDRVTIPVDLLDIQYIVRTSDLTKPLIRRSVEDIAQLQRNRLSVAGEPVYYCISGANMIVTPIPNGSKTYDMSYYQRIPPLAQYNTNWVLTYHPDLYVYAALLHAAPYMADADLEASMRARVETMVQAINDTQTIVKEGE